MNVVKKAMAGCALAGAGLVLAALPAGSALASTTVGQTGPPLGTNYFRAGAEVVQADAATPAGGTVTSLNTQVGSCPLFQGGTYDLQVLRPLGGGQYQVLGDTGNHTDPCDSQLHSYPVNIPVQAGDVIGAYAVSRWQGLLSRSSGTTNAGYIPAPAVGDTISLTITETTTIDESATLESASEAAAATLVSDTTGPPPGKALAEKATAIQAAVTAGNTATACTGITSFRGLVNAQTGKKLTSAQAARLTTDAGNLAAALGC